MNEEQLQKRKMLCQKIELLFKLTDENTQLQSQLTEERTKLELMMSRVAEVEVKEFESACN